MKYILFLIVAGVSICFLSCKRESAESEYLRQAREIIIDDPKSALALLDSIKHPENLDKKDRMNYVVARVRAKYKNYMDIKGDSLILAARDYLEKSNASDADKMLAYYYAGCFYKELDEYDEALRNYLHSLEYAKNENNPYLIGYAHKQIGDLYYHEDIPDSAILHYKRALPYFEKPEFGKHQMHIYRFLGFSYNILEDYNKASSYFEEGLKKSINLKDTSFIHTFNYGLGITNKKIEDYEKSKLYFRKCLSLKIPERPNWEINTFAHLLEIHTITGQIDSASYYADKVLSELHKQDDYLHLFTYKSIERLNETKGDFHEALKYNKLSNQYQEKINEAKNKSDIHKIEKKYSLAKRDKTIAIMEKQNFTYKSIVFLFALAILLSIFFIRYLKIQNKSDRQKKEIAEQKQLLAEKDKELISAQNEKLEKEKEFIKTQKELVESEKNLVEVRNQLIEEKNNILDKQLKNMTFATDVYKMFMRKLAEFNDQTETMIKIARKPVNGNNGKSVDLKLSEKIYENFESMWKDIKNLKEACSILLEAVGMDRSVMDQLKPNDLLLLALIQCKFEAKDIADILNCNVQALSMRKNRLKEKLRKLGLPEGENDRLTPKLSGENS